MFTSPTNNEIQREIILLTKQKELIEKFEIEIKKEFYELKPIEVDLVTNYDNFIVKGYLDPESKLSRKIVEPVLGKIARQI